MNKIFLIFSVIITLISVAAGIFILFNSEVGFSPKFPELKTFPQTYSDVKEIGFVTDNKTSEYYFYKVQNSVIPVFVINNAKLNHIICFEEKNNNFCNEFSKKNKYQIINKYSNNLYLLKSEGGAK